MALGHEASAIFLPMYKHSSGACILGQLGPLSCARLARYGGRVRSSSCHGRDEGGFRVTDPPKKF
jgi:hypothetical protein